MATSKTLTGVGDVFGIGTSVGAYKRSNWGAGASPTTGVAAPGSADATASVSTAGALAFTGLTDATQYVAGASVGGTWRYVAFNTVDKAGTAPSTPADASLDLAQFKSSARGSAAWAPGLGLETCPRGDVDVSTTTLPASGTLLLAGGIVIPRGVTVSSITFITGGTGFTTPANQWFALVDQSRNVLAKTADDTTTAWASNTPKTLALSTPYLASADTPVYVGILVVATGMGNFRATGAALNSVVGGVAPIIVGSSTTALTTPASLGATAAALAATGLGIPYAYLS